MKNNFYIYNPYLAHYGVEGMKWGVRRYQNPDGSLTTEGRVHYKANNITGKIGVGVGSAALVAAAAVAGTYAYKKYGGKYLDTVLKAGTEVKTISMDPNFQNGNRIFAALDKGDQEMYKNRYGYELRQKNKMFNRKDEAYQLTRKAKEKIKIASDNNGKKALIELIKENPEVDTGDGIIKKFNDILKDDVAAAGGPGVDPGKLNLNNKKFMDDYYHKFNVALVNKDPEAIAMNNKFYDRLKAKGYAGVKDANDRMLGGQGYRANNPAIIFEMNKLQNVKVNTIKQNLNDWKKGTDRIEKRMNFEMNALPVSGQLGFYGGLGAGSGALLVADSNKALKEDEKRKKS